MRVAVCVSGTVHTGNDNGDLIRNNAIQKSKFLEADFYYATWDSYQSEFEKYFPNDKCEYFPEVNMHYHPYTDIEKKDHISNHYQKTIDWVVKGGRKRLDWTSHHTKQILIHSWLLNKLEADYDVIVRTRFDGFIHNDADFSKYLDDTYTNLRANCFGATVQNLFDVLRDVGTEPGTLYDNWLLDQLIIHPANAIDTNSIVRLHKEKKLHAAEYGWYQVISMPHGSTHKNHSGWVNHDKNVLDKFLNK